MLDHNKLKQLVERHRTLGRQMSENPDPETYVALASEYSHLDEVVAKIGELNSVEADLKGLEELLGDALIDGEMREMAEQEQPELRDKAEALIDEIKMLLLPRDAADDKSAVLEIRAGTGGSEAALFAGDLFRMYERYAADAGWKVEAVSYTHLTLPTILRV